MPLINPLMPVPLIYDCILAYNVMQKYDICLQYVITKVTECYILLICEVVEICNS